MSVEKQRRTAAFSGEYSCLLDSYLTIESNPGDLCDMFGYSFDEMEQICSSGMLHLIVEEEREERYEKICGQARQTGQVEVMLPLCRKDGTILWVMNRGCYRKEGDGLEYIDGILVDLTWSKYRYDEEREAAKGLHEQVCKDSLTDIYNASTSRKLAEEYFEETDNERKCALLIIDLDDFKQVNDQKGHMFGDAVLVQAARAIRKLFRSNDIVGRIGGDEFMVLMKDISDKEIVKKRCHQLNEILRTVFEEEFSDVMPSCSIGVGFSPEHGDSYYTLFCCADRALYQAKEEGRQRYVFYEEAVCGPMNNSKDSMQYAGYDMNVLRGYLE